MRPRIEERVEKLLADHGIVEIPVPVDRIARAEGVKITQLRSEDSESGFAMSKGSLRVIGVNQLHAPKRRRFTIAHEIGHLLLHHESDALTVDRSIRVSFRDDVSSLATDEQEIQANAFAAALLMPRQWVYREVRAAYDAVAHTDDLVKTLARRFEVSNEAMGYRLINLGVTNP